MTVARGTAPSPAPAAIQRAAIHTRAITRRGHDPRVAIVCIHHTSVSPHFVFVSDVRSAARIMNGVVFRYRETNLKTKSETNTSGQLIRTETQRHTVLGSNKRLKRLTTLSNCFVDDSLKNL
jgi:hypothetical protein